MIVLYVQGVVALGLVLAAVGWAAVRIRRRLVPSWSGPPARLAEVTAGLALLFAVLHVLGAVGLFRRWWIVLGCVAAAVAVVRFVRPAGDADTGQDDPAASSTAPPRWTVVVVLGLATLVLAHWLSRTLAAFDHGIADYDSLAYHLPHAARFVQTGWITDLYFNKPEWPNMLHPDDAELLHATGMALFGRDFLSPFLNLGWAALMLLAAWCVGIRAGVAHLTFAAGLVILASPAMAAFEPGTAANDIPSVGLFLVAVAFLMHDHRSRSAVLLAGAAAGMALGTKLTVLVPLLALTVALGVLVWRRQRALVVAWTVPVVLTGSFWYVRNLFRTGSPLPSLKIGVGPLSFPSGEFTDVENFGYTIADYVTDGDVWREWLLPGLDHALGPAWWLLLIAAAVALGVCFARGSALVRALAIGSVAAIVGHAVNPASAFGLEGQPVFFQLNLRYVYIGLAVPLIVAPTLAVVRSRPVVQAGFVALVSALVLASQFADYPNIEPWAATHRRSAVALALLGLASVVAVGWYRRRSPVIARPMLAALAAVAVLVALAGGYVAERRFLSNRYGLNPLGVWAAGRHHDRIAQAGFDRGYPLYGRDLSNRVQYVGRRGPHGSWHDFDRCTEWRSALGDGGYRFVVLTLGEAPGKPHERWIMSDPNARMVLRTRTEAVYELTQPPDPAGCPAGAEGEAPDPVDPEARS